jgi:hypothetical protein
MVNININDLQEDEYPCHAKQWPTPPSLVPAYILAMGNGVISSSLLQH